MDLKSLKIKDGVFDTIYYVKKENNSPNYVFGERGTFMRHVVESEKHGIFHVITPATNEVLQMDTIVKLVNPILFIDRVNGNDVAPNINVFAEKLDRV